MSSDEPEGRLSAAKSWIITAFAAPSALAVLAKMDDRLDFLPFLERIISGFDKVSLFAWRLIGNIIHSDLSEIHGVLTFYVICLAMMLRFSLGKKNFASGSLASKLFESAAMSIVIVALISSRAWSGTDYLYTFVFFGTLFGYATATENRDRISGFETIVAIIVMAIAVSVFIFVGSSKIETAVTSIIGIISAYTIRYIGSGNLFFARVFVFCAGVFILNFSGNTLVPLIDNFLTRIGA